MRGLPLQLETSLTDQTGDALDIILETVRTHMEMQVAYLSEFVDGQSVFRAVSAPGLEDVISRDQSIGLDQVYCQHILNGDLPQLMTDTSDYDLARSLPITRDMPIGSHMSVPVYRDDGSVYGMFCCLRSTPNPTLSQRDMRVMETFANLASKQINSSLAKRQVLTSAHERIDSALAEGGFHMVLQPIVSLTTGEPTKFEALSRFSGPTQRPPNLWYEEAAQVGRQEELEIASIQKSLALLDQLPGSVSIGVNASPASISSGAIFSVIPPAQRNRIIVEVTEHAAVEDHSKLAIELRNLQNAGIRIAIDDVGTGFSGLISLLRMKPEILKLDIELIRDIDKDPAKQSLVMGMVHFAQQTGAKTIAEGVETEAELNMLRALNVHQGQGYLFARPMAIDDACMWLERVQKSPLFHAA